MIYMNDHDIEQVRGLAHTLELPNLTRAADTLAAFADWTDSNSDGWAYWAPPRRAAQLLQALLTRWVQDYYRGEAYLDLDASDLTRSLRPIKAFLTRNGVVHGDVIAA